MIDRRTWLARTGGAALLLLAGRREAALALVPPKPVVEAYKDPGCECCSKWIDHMRTSGFTVNVHDDRDVAAFKDKVGVPAAMRSCHTGTVGGYVVEGHVPAADVKRMLRERPRVLGLAIPGMPMSAPGMGQPGAPIQPYKVLAFTRSGTTRVYAEHS